MAGICRLHRVHREGTEPIGHLAFGSRLNQRNLFGKGANYSRLTSYNRPMIEMPFTSPADFAAGVAAPAEGSEAFWFVFKADRLLVELGPPSPRPSDDLRVPARPSWARLPLLKNNNGLWFEPARTLYLGRLAGTDCWAAEAPADAAPPPQG